jgi:benzoyl-CoA reductase/2-hydroxyglutaryl-CoA dehydratase subunit BcrC/BadD/HgdB
MSSYKGFQFKSFDFSKTIDTNIDLIDLVTNTVGTALKKQPDHKRWIFQPVLDVIDNFNACKEHPEKVVYHHFTFPPEIVLAMDCLSFIPEVMVFIMPTEYACALVDEGREMGAPDHYCGFLGGVLSPLFANRLLKPRAILHCNQPCDNSVAHGNVLAESFPDTEIFMMDSAYSEDEEDIRFCSEQLREAFRYLERMMGKKLDLDKFREVMFNSAKAYRLMYEINEYKKAIPCPIPYSGILRQTSLAFYALTGTEALVRWLKRHLADTKERYDKGIGGWREEKMRVVWNFSWPIYDYAVYDWMEEVYGAIAVGYHSAEPFYQPPDIDYSRASFEELLRALALRNINTAMGRQGRGHFMTFVNDSLKWCREYKADACIFAGHWQCQASWAAGQLTKEKLMEELGIPMLIMAVDQLDPRITSAEQMVSRMEPFLEMVAERKSHGPKDRDADKGVVEVTKKTR